MDQTKTWLKPILGPPLMVTMYLLLAVCCSAIWLYSFNIQIFESNTKTNAASATTRHRNLLILLLAYVIHLPLLVSLPYTSRPWLWKDDNKNNNSLRLLSRILGWDEGTEESPTSWGCIIAGVRAVASFLLAWAPFALFVHHGGSHATNIAGILGLALEGFFAAEMVKHTEAEDGFFMCQMASATCAAQRAFGLGGRNWWTVFSVCLSLIFFRSVLPFYEDVFTLLPEPYNPGSRIVPAPKEGEGTIEVVTDGSTQPPTAQLMSQNTNATVIAAVSAPPAR